MREKRSVRRPGNGDGGSHWISYSDMMASLLMLFVMAVFVCVYRLNQQKMILIASQNEIEEQRIIIIGQTASMDVMKIQLSERENELDLAQIRIDEQQAEISNMLILLGEKQTELDRLILTNQEQENLLKEKERQIAQLIGVRSDIISKLSVSLTRANLNTSVDEKTGDIVLKSTVLFDKNTYMIKDSGKDFLSRFLPVYLNVLLSDEYKDYVGEITIEGHTDTDGDYLSNMKLSQERARAVAEYCLQIPGLSAAQRAMFEKVLCVTGRSEADPIYVSGTNIEDKDASRRVTFKFRLKDSDMVNEMHRLLSGEN